MCSFRDLRRFAFGAVIAPQVILAQWLNVLADRNYRRACSVECDRLHLIACDGRLFQGLARCRSQRPHVIVMGLRRVLCIFALAVEWVLGDCGFDQTPFAVHQRNANAQGSEVDSRHDRHQQAPLSQP